MYHLQRAYQLFPHRGLEYIIQHQQKYISSSMSSSAYTLETSSFQQAHYGIESTHFSHIFSYTPTALPNSSHYTHQLPNYHLLTPQLEYHFTPDHFLKPGKEGIFVGKAEEIRPFIEEAFTILFHQPFPNDIKLTICSEFEFRKIAPSRNTIGISFNRKKYGLLSEIFVLNDSLGRVMLTIGHELGHVLTETLEDQHSEEAKAFAFSLAWMNAIREKNIANLQEAIILERPAENGLHNIAFTFVQKLQNEIEVWEIYLQLIRKELSITAL